MKSLTKPLNIWRNPSLGPPAKVVASTTRNATLPRGEMRRLLLANVVASTGRNASLDDNFRKSNVEIAPIKGNEGDHEYMLPTNVDFAQYNTVVIYCERFRAVFGSAGLQPF